MTFSHCWAALFSIFTSLLSYKCLFLLDLLIVSFYNSFLWQSKFSSPFNNSLKNYTLLQFSTVPHYHMAYQSHFLSFFFSESAPTSPFFSCDMDWAFWSHAEDSIRRYFFYFIPIFDEAHPLETLWEKGQWSYLFLDLVCLKTLFFFFYHRCIWLINQLGIEPSVGTNQSGHIASHPNLGHTIKPHFPASSQWDLAMGSTSLSWKWETSRLSPFQAFCARCSMLFPLLEIWMEVMKMKV